MSGSGLDRGEPFNIHDRLNCPLFKQCYGSLKVLACCDRTKDILKRHPVLCQIHQCTLHKDMGQILHSKVHGTYLKLSNILVWLVGYRKGDCSSAKKLDSRTTLPFGAVSILIARRASSRTRHIRTSYLDIHTWRTDFPASWTTTVAIYRCHRRLPVDDEARRKKQASEGYFHRAATSV